MSQKYRIPRLPVVLALLALFAVSAATAGGGPEADEVSPAGSEPARAPFAEAATIEDAVNAALAIPDSWNYDPGARYIYNEEDQVPYPLQIDDTVWLTRLADFDYYVLRQKGTEYAFSNPMHSSKERGIYYSRATGQPLFSSEDKYDSGTGWPSFSKPINPDAIVYIGDTTLFAPRIEVVDSLSGSHLGHVFPDGPAPTGQRYCINAASLIFVPDGEDPPPLIQELLALAAAESQ